jgi:peptidoglycan/xylan/chitin deacetylase (PgdA/CDA1 family)
MNALSLSIKIAAGVAGTAGIASLAYGSFAPGSGLWGKVYTRAPAGTPGVALTFDDGPARSATPAILDILGELGVKAVFFVIGANVRQCPDLLERMHAEGHLVGNHSLDHGRAGLAHGRRYWDHQLRETDRIIQETIGVCPAMFRPPFGFKTWCNMSVAARQGKAVIAWSRRAWDGVKTTSERIVQRLNLPTRAGEILLLHDGAEPQRNRDARPTIEALKPLIMRLRDRGLEMRPLDQLLKLRAYMPAASAAPTA